VKSRRIVPLYRKAVALKDSFRGITIKWIPREENWEADALTSQAYKEALAKVRESRRRDAA
jgi:ribonuclease HI